MIAAYETFMVICFVVFALISVGIFVITVIKFIHYIRDELKGEYGEPNKPLMIASVVGAIILTALSVLTAYLSIKSIADVLNKRAERDNPHIAQIIISPMPEPISKPAPLVLPVLEIETEEETEIQFVERVVPDRYTIIVLEFQNEIEYEEIEERELGAAAEEPAEQEFTPFTQYERYGETAKLKMSEKGQKIVYDTAKKYELPYRVVLALLGVETNWNEDEEHIEVNGGVRYIGIGCINEKYHADNLATKGIDIYTLKGNIEGICWLLKAQYDRFGTIELALMAYNAGGGYTQGQVERGITENSYSQKVMSFAESFK